MEYYQEIRQGLSEAFATIVPRNYDHSMRAWNRLLSRARKFFPKVNLSKATLETIGQGHKSRAGYPCLTLELPAGTTHPEFKNL